MSQKNAVENVKMRVIPAHPQGDKQKLGLQAYDYGYFSSLIM